MSRLRIGLCATLVALAVVAGLLAQEARDTIGPLEQKANAITPENPVPRRTISVSAVYPAEARAIDAVATVSLVATLDASGRVAEIRKLGNPIVITPPGAPANPVAVRAAGDALVQSAVSALGQWQYEPPSKPPISFPVTFNFTQAGEPTASQDVSGRRFPISPPPPPLPPPAAAAAPPWPAAVGAVRVGGAIKPPTQTNRVAPVYPAIAQSARVQGVVILEALLGADGKVADARVLRSIPLLDQAALDAVKQWEYSPTLLNGVPTPVIMTVTVNFTLPEPPAPANQ